MNKTDETIKWLLFSHFRGSNLKKCFFYPILLFSFSLRFSRFWFNLLQNGNRFGLKRTRIFWNISKWHCRSQKALEWWLQKWMYITRVKWEIGKSGSIPNTMGFFHFFTACDSFHRKSQFDGDIWTLIYTIYI